MKEIEPEIEEFIDNPSYYDEIVERTTKSICQFSSEKTEMANAFLCKIYISPIRSFFHFLIICNIFIRHEDTKLGKEILLFINNVKKVLKIDLSRNILRENKKDGITIIEIKSSDDINLDSLLEIDYNNIKSNSEKIYK